MTSGCLLSALFGTRQRNFAKPDDKPNHLPRSLKMTKQLFALAIAAAFGIAHAADVKPAAAEMKSTAGAVKADAQKPADAAGKAEAKVLEAKPATAAVAPEAKKEEAKPVAKKVVKKETKVEPAAVPEAAVKAEATKTAETAKK